MRPFGRILLVATLLCCGALTQAQEAKTIPVVTVRKAAAAPLGDVHGVWQLAGISDASYGHIVPTREHEEILRFEVDQRCSHAIIDGKHGQTLHGVFLLDSLSRTLEMRKLRKGHFGDRLPDRTLHVERIDEQWLVLKVEREGRTRWMHFELVKRVKEFGDGY